jgi:WD40 repeat protein/mono/diheme cytochrome c family protein
MFVVRILAVMGMLSSGGLPALFAQSKDEKNAALPAEVSYYKDVRPIFQQNCQGCHQPAKAQGGFVMTSHADLLKAGESEKPGIIPGKPDESHVLQQITPKGDKRPAMPREKDPLVERDVNLIKKWIAQGAKDDTPASAKARVVDAEHPPNYALPAVITAIDYSPEGALVAVAGYHEILLHKADGSGLVARLVGVSERVQSLAWSPDGKMLAATGGNPGRFGEVQIWEIKRKTTSVAKQAAAVSLIASTVPVPGAPTAHATAGFDFDKLPGYGEIATAEVIETKLKLSYPVTYDTVYGVSWSHDGTKLAFGCADNSLRAIDVKTGKQILYQGAHSDWVLATCFSRSDLFIVSVSRDRSMKLTEVATQRFNDNITSITPGALKGGLLTVDIRPLSEKRMVPPSPDTVDKRPILYDELLVAGADGVPRLYKMHRSVKRVIGDDANKLKEYDAMPGRTFAARFSSDGTRFVAGSSLDGKGEGRVYGVEDRKLICKLEGERGAIYAVAFHPNGSQVATAGFDGTVRINDATTGKLVKEFSPFPGKSVAAGNE